MEILPIRKGVPIPPRTGGASRGATGGGRRKGCSGRTAVYPWADMEVGDCFEVRFTMEDDDILSGAALTRLHGAVAKAGMRQGRRYSVRTWGMVATVWRVE